MNINGDLFCLTTNQTDVAKSKKKSNLYAYCSACTMPLTVESSMESEDRKWLRVIRRSKRRKL